MFYGPTFFSFPKVLAAVVGKVYNAIQRNPTVEQLRLTDIPSHNNGPSLCFKAKLSAKPLIWKWSFILMQIKLIIARKVLNLASVWKWEFLELANWPVCRLFPSNSVSRSNVASIHTAENIRDQNTQLFYFRIFF